MQMLEEIRDYLRDLERDLVREIREIKNEKEFKIKAPVGSRYKYSPTFLRLPRLPEKDEVLTVSFYSVEDQPPYVEENWKVIDYQTKINLDDTYCEITILTELQESR